MTHHLNPSITISFQPLAPRLILWDETNPDSYLNISFDLCIHARQNIGIVQAPLNSSPNNRCLHLMKWNTNKIELLNEKSWTAHKIILLHFSELLLRKDYTNTEKNYQHPTWKTGPEQIYGYEKHKLHEKIRKLARTVHAKSEDSNLQSFWI